MSALIRKPMSAPIEFHDQGRLEAYEIREEIPDRNLPTELVAGETASSKEAPELLFLCRGNAAQPAGSGCRVHGDGRWRSMPSTARNCCSPIPHPGPLPSLRSAA